MYSCTMCGLKKSVLGSNPDFEFRSRRLQNEEAYIEGISEWCAKCGALRFFIKSNNDTDPTQYMGEQPKRQLDNYMLEATAKGCQETGRDGGSKLSKRFGQDVNVPPTRKMLREMRHEARKVFRRELLATMPSQLPRGSLWEHKLRSVSMDHDFRRESPTTERRSKSVINDPHKTLRMPKQPAAVYNVQEKDMSKSDVLKPNRRAQLNGRNSAVKAEKQNHVEVNLVNGIDVDETRTAIPYKNTLPIGRMQQLELLSPWQEQVSRRTNQLLAKSLKKDPKLAQNSYTDLPDADNFNGVDAAGGGATAEQVGQENQLNQKLLEKQNLLSEWERIRVRVEGECERVKTELDELHQHLRNKGMTRSKRNPPTVRQTGGAQLRPACPHQEPENEPQKSREKSIGDALDEKLECLLDTLQETSQQTEPQGNENNETSIFAPTAPSASQMDVVHGDNQTDTTQPGNQNDMSNSLLVSDNYVLKPKRLLSKLHMLVSTAQRARFRGFPEDPQQLLQNLSTAELMKHRDPPAAQFSTLPCNPNELIALLSMKREVLEPNVVRQLNVCRSPIFCPDADCRRMFFISDFNDHLTHEHPTLAMERITPCQAKTFFLDTRVTLLNKAKCNMVYFVKDKFIDKNTEKYPDLLPVLVMTARLLAADFFRSDDHLGQSSTACSTGPDQEIFLIWLTSIRPDDTKIIGTISVWPTSSQPIVEYLMVHTNEVYNIRSAQRLKSIYNSNRVMALPGSFVNRMTDGGKCLLAVQVLIH